MLLEITKEEKHFISKSHREVVFSARCAELYKAHAAAGNLELFHIGT